MPLENDNNRNILLNVIDFIWSIDYSFATFATIITATFLLFFRKVLFREKLRNMKTQRDILWEIRNIAAENVNTRTQFSRAVGKRKIDDLSNKYSRIIPIGVVISIQQLDINDDSTWESVERSAFTAFNKNKWRALIPF